MRLLRIALHGLRGRKRDTMILGSILFLAFLFLSLSSVLLSSFAETAQLRRQALHGNWQVLYYGADRVAEERCAGLADCGVIEIVGTTKDNRLIGAIDETVRSIGALQLVEGRLPAGEDEIVLVRGRMAEEPAVGEEFKTVYQYSYMRGGSGNINDWENQRQAVLDSLRAGESYLDDDTYPVVKINRSWEELHGEFLRYVRENYDPEANCVHLSSEQMSFDYPLPPGYDLERLLDEAEDDLLYDWAVHVLHPGAQFGAYHISTVRALPGGLFGYEGFLINVLNEGVETSYTGWAFSDEVKTRQSARMQTANALLYKTYTVVGYVAPYADHWDARGLTMPDAFVSHDAAAAQLRAIRRAEEEYYEGAPSYEPSEILLLQNPEQDWKAVAEQAIAVFSEVQKPYFKVEGIEEEAIGSQQTGVIIGLDPETGEEKVCELQQYGTVGFFLTDPQTGDYAYLSGDPRAESRWATFSSILLPLQPEQLTLEELENNNTHPLRLNQYAYPSSGTAEQSLQTLCSGILIGVAACSVFQVFWVQLRRRRMRLTTLMSIGASDGQVFGMLLLEIVLLLTATGLLGTALGFGLSHILTKRLETVYTVQWGQLLGGLSLCLAAVTLSAMIPMLLVLRTPLTGREQVSRHTLRLRAPQAHRRQSYARIVLRQMQTNRSRTLLQVTMSFLLAAICLLTVYFCHSSYSDYRRMVEDTAMPDYEIVLPYGISQRYLSATLEQHPTLLENTDLFISREAPNVYLHCDALLGSSPIVKALSERSRDCFRDLPDDQTGLAVRVLGLEEDALRAFCARLPAGAVDFDAVLEGESCVVLVPRFEDENGLPADGETDENAVRELRADELAGYLLALHYGERYASVMAEDRALAPGDTLVLSAFSQTVSEQAVTEQSKELSLAVETVVSTLSPPLWPISEKSPAFVIVTGQRAIPKLYPYASISMTAAQTRYFTRMSALFYPDCYGLTRFVFTNREGTDKVSMDTAAYDFAQSLGVELQNYRLIKEREESNARNRMLLFLLLGVEMALVLSTLLFSAAGMAAEQDRFRFGLLQAIGLSNGQIFLGQILQSFALAVIGCAAANLLLGAAQLFAALLSRHPRLALLENLGTYPWALHGVVCLGFVLAYTLLQSLPIRRLGEVEPIENMRS